ncbi:Rho family protein [Aspergillus lucknowensis]|uniref:P-loop containing nucleoside triphosphate hydrolase protein n=1 Tax=Aspergillus lucknowensis TaxID=176173 RepID=A0ABR4LH16_9EURO
MATTQSKLKRVKYVKPSKSYTSYTSSLSNTSKCVVVGDNNVGKTTLLTLYTTGKLLLEDQIPRVFDNYSQQVGDYALELWDTYKPEEYDRYRQYCYPNTDIILVCFSVAREASFYNVKDFWTDEIQTYRPETPWLLVGTKTDLRDAPGASEVKHFGRANVFIMPEEGRSAAKQLGASGYVECSSKEDLNVKEVFDEVRSTRSTLVALALCSMWVLE